MKISLNTIRRLNEQNGSTGDVAAIGVDSLVEKIGAQLGAVEDTIDFGRKYQGVIIVKVVTCDKHPNADKLSVCWVDDGGIAGDVERNGDGLVQVVCGATNVRAGMLAAWLPPGSTVPDSVDDDPFVLEARELRGVVSNGMLASPKELALGDSHEGILDIAGDFKPGTDFAEAFGFKDDVVLDIENKMFTHRPDCFGWLGVSRELAGIQGMAFKSPDWYVPGPEFPAVEGDALPLSVQNELPGLVPRFTAIALSDVTVKPSDALTQAELIKHGQKPINNIVDYTNYFMLLTGQPIHAYDYDKVKALSDGEPRLTIRNPRPGEKIKLLNGKEIEPRPEAMMVAADKALICVGGVMGGTDTEVDESTKNVIIEAANWDMYELRRTAMEHGLFTDAVTRFTKGQSPLQNLAVLRRIVGAITGETSGETVGSVASPVIDDNHVPQASTERQALHPPVTLPAEFVNARLGLKLSAEEMMKLLENVEFNVTINAGELTVTAPFWRTDVELREDVVEEVGRLYGYDHLPLELPLHDLTPAPKDPLLTLKAEIRSRLCKMGANEVLTYSFVHGNLLDKVGQDKSKAFQVANALSPNLQYYRLSLVPSLLEKVHSNIKAGYNEFALFELGKTHAVDQGADDDGLPREFEFAALVVAAADKLKKPGAAFYQARKYLTALTGLDLESLVLKPIGVEMQEFPVVQPYDEKRSALVSIKGGEFLGIIGEFKPAVARALKLPKYSAGFEVDVTALQHILTSGPSYRPLSRYPGVKQDITLRVPAEIPFDQLYDFVAKQYGANAPDDTHIELDVADIYQKADDAGHKQVTFRLTTTGMNRTLTDKEVNKLLDNIAAAASKINAERI